MTTRDYETQIQRLQADLRDLNGAADMLQRQGLPELAAQTRREADKIQGVIAHLEEEADRLAREAREAELTDGERRVVDALTVAPVNLLRAYRGRRGCQCGCLGTHWHTEAGFSKLSGQHQQYAAKNGAQVKRVAREVVDRVYSGDYHHAGYSDEHSRIVWLDYTTEGGTEMTITIELA